MNKKTAKISSKNSIDSNNIEMEDFLDGRTEIHSAPKLHSEHRLDLTVKPPKKYIEVKGE